MELTINSVGQDGHGRCYDIGDDEPYDAITIDEADGTITLHGHDTLESHLRDLLAIVRDHELGYREFHKSPTEVLQESYDELVRRGHDADELVLPEDQEELGLAPLAKSTDGAEPASDS